MMDGIDQRRAGSTAVDPYGKCGIDHRRPLREMRDRPSSTLAGNEGSTTVDPYGCGGFITVDDAGSTAVDPYGKCGIDYRRPLREMRD